MVWYSLECFDVISFWRLGSVGGVVFGGVFPTEPTGAISVGSGYRDQDTQPGTETHP